MKNHTSGPSPSLRRAAHARPRALLAAALATTSLSAWWAMAQNAKSSASKPAVAKSVAKAAPAKLAKGAASTQKPLNLRDLPEFVREIGKQREAAANGGNATAKSTSTKATANTKVAGGGVIAAAPGVGKLGFALTEADLTSGNTSDERQPAFSPGGDFIAFISNGADANGDGKIDSLNANGFYHVWIMTRNGTQQRQITGLTTSGPTRDDNLNQSRPAWAPSGNEIVYIQQGAVVGGGTAPQLYVIQPFSGDGNASIPGVQPVFEQRTFFVGNKQAPTWNPSGQSIAFACDAALWATNDTNTANDPNGDYDIFTINNAGNAATVLRLTGGSVDSANGRIANDLNPSWGLGNNQSIVFFSSNRTDTAVLPTGRRIWLVSSSGSGQRVLTDPTVRPGGSVTDIDDFPSSTATGVGVVFESNSPTDASDVPPSGARDHNVWSLANVPVVVPTPTPIPTAIPRLLVSSFTNSQVIDFDPVTRSPRAIIADAGNGLANPEGITAVSDRTGDGVEDFLVSNRNNGNGSIDLIDGANASYIGQFVAPGAGGLTNPTGLVVRGSYIYVGSGTNDGQNSTNAIHRFNLSDGTPAGTTGTAGSSVFSRLPAGVTNPVTNGIEGLTFGPDANGDGIQDIYASAYSDDIVTVYDGSTSVGSAGLYIKTYVTAGSGGLSGPTGLAFGPDGNLYVSSSGRGSPAPAAGNDDIKRYAPAAAIGVPATFIDNYVDDNDGTVTGLSDPEGLSFGPDIDNDGVGDLFVSSFSQTGAPGNGNRLNAYKGDITGAAAAVQLPAPNSPYVQTSSLRGPSYFVFNSTAAVVGTPTPTPTPLPAVTTPAETGGNPAVLETNPLSSPNRATSAGFAQDKSADREPSYARAGSTAQNSTQIVFASQRRTASAPGTNPTDPSPPVMNPGGGDENIGGADTPPTHDIWITTTQDYTPPILLPQSVGNQTFPVIAPGPQAPFTAPRTAEAGLNPNGTIAVACVVEDRDSGLNSLGSVYVTFKNADSYQYNTYTTLVNESIPVRVAQELQPSDAPGSSFLPLTTYDDGPPSAGGHELQAGAIKGDGVYYCENRSLVTPAASGDFYMDILTVDRSGNFLNYDNIWGFSTRPFAKANSTSDLFVSDYTVGQTFPTLSGDPRFINIVPVESYYLTNPGGDILSATTFSIDNTASVPAQKTTFGNVDVWRILCRGEVPESILATYAPRVEQQLEPADYRNGLPSGFPATAAKTRNVAVASSSVIWAAPYGAFVFTGPGTIFDAETQRRLTNYLNAGGRLFLSGRDIAYSLSNNGSQTNTFLRDKLRANFESEFIAPSTNVLDPEAGKFTPYENFGPRYAKAAYNTLQVPMRAVPPVATAEAQQNTFEDAALNQSLDRLFTNPQPNPTPRNYRFTNFRGGTDGTDIISPVTGTGVDITPCYSISGNTVAQRVVDNSTTSGLESRVIFFGFGFEGVNRRYSKDATFTTNPSFCVNVRSSMAESMRRFMKTGGVAGRVVNDNTNQPISNFLVEFVGNGRRYFAITDSNGDYQILGIPAEGNSIVTPVDQRTESRAYTLRPAQSAVSGGFALNPGFFKNEGRLIGIDGVGIQSGDLRVIPSPSGNVTGTAAQSNGTPDDPSDDTVLPNVPVLIVSDESSSVFPNGGRYAQLTTTDSGGRFAFSNVPSNDTANGQAKVTYRIIFNPTVNDIPETSGLRSTYGGQNPNFRRREIPDSRRPAAIIVPVGETFVANDPLPTDATKADDKTDNGIKIVIPVGPSIIGRVLLNGTPVGGASIELLDAAGNSLTPPRTATSVASVDSLGNNYSLFDVPPGTYQVKATLTIAGYPNPLTATVSVTVGSVVVTAPDVQAPDLRLEKQDITGIVRYNNVPLQGAVVTLLAPDGTTVIGKPPLLTDNPVTTGADGSYTFLRVDPGSYIIRAVAPNGVSKDVPITIVAGQDLALNIDLYASNVSGTVTLNGSPLGGATVELIQNGQTVKSTTTASDGTYTFTLVAPGVYTVRASSNGDSADFALTVSPGVDRTGINLDLFLQSISGTITLNGSPIKGALVELISNGQVIQSVVSADDGTYKFDRVAAGVFTIRASYLEDSVSIDVTVNRGAGGDRTGIDIELKLQTITGRVLLNRLDGKGPQPIGSAGIQLYRGAKLMNATTSAANGTYRFINVGPGTYTVRGGRFGDTASVTVVVTRGKDVVAPDIILFLQNVTGIITQNGKPLKGAAVQFINSKGAGLARAATDANGRYTFVGVPSGNFTIRASYQGDSVERIVNVKRGQNLTAPTLDLKAQVIAGTVTVNGVRTANVIVELVQKANDRVIQRVKTDAKGSYIFNLVIVGTYTVRATYLGDTVSRDITVRRGVNGRMPVLALAAQTLSGSVTVDGRPASGVVAQLIRVEESGEVGQARTTSDARGNYTFGQVPAGRYLVRLTPPGIASRQVPVNVVRGVNTIVPLLNFASPAAPAPTPTPTPNPANEEFQPTGQIYQISVPYTDSVEPNSTTTVAKAFNALPIDRNNVENYRISRYDARTQQYVGLSANSVIRRGEGYFLEPLARGVTIRRPATDATRKPTNVRTFTITLRNNASRPAAEQTNGFNLIGFPFDPARFDLAEWSAAEVVVPDGRRFRTVTEAAAAGILSQTLFTYDSDTGQYTPISDSMVPFRGYFARTFIDGVQVILHPSTTATP